MEWTNACYSLILSLNGSEQEGCHLSVMDDTNDSVEAKE